MPLAQLGQSSRIPRPRGRGWGRRATTQRSCEESRVANVPRQLRGSDDHGGRARPTPPCGLGEVTHHAHLRASSLAGWCEVRPEPARLCFFADREATRSKGELALTGSAFECAVDCVVIKPPTGASPTKIKLASPEEEAAEWSERLTALLAPSGPAESGPPMRADSATWLSENIGSDWGAVSRLATPALMSGRAGRRPHRHPERGAGEAAVAPHGRLSRHCARGVGARRASPPRGRVAHQRRRGR